MKRIHILSLFAILVAMFAVMPSCKNNNDDDPKDNGQEPNNQTDPDDVALSDNPKAEEDAFKFWSVASQIVGFFQYTADYENATFEPVIGKEDGNTRIVATNTMETAAQRFADLTGTDVDENTTTYTYSDPAVGTLTYTKVNDGTTFATVDVNIKQIPHVEKIIYQASSDENGSFGDKKAWYRFGDIVKRTNKDGVEEYWICVRPAFTYEKKEDSHWVCVSKLSDSNLKHYQNGDKQYYLPTKLGNNKEHMQNFAEMLYAITHPQDWFDNCTYYGSDKLKIFHDFSYKNIKYHNQYFWANVWAAWKNTPEVATALNMKTTDFAKLAEIIDNDGVNLLYNGYSWWGTWKSNCDLYQATYTCGNTNKEKNMHDADYRTISEKVYEYSLDFRDMQKPNNYSPFFKNDGKQRWVIRHATGKELNGGRQPDATAAIQGVTEVYRYYSKDYYESEFNKAGGPEITEKTNPDVQKYGYYQVGDVVTDVHKDRWFCISPAFNIDDDQHVKSALFVSFDFNSSRDWSGTSSLMLLPTKKEIYECATKFMSAYIKIMQDETVGPQIREHIKENAQVDLKKLCIEVDSNQSTNTIFCLAYGNGTESSQPIVRCIHDNTKAGFEYYRFYTSYEGKNSDTYMHLQDINNETLVNKYAKNDKWVTLPLHGTTQRREPRTETELSFDPKDWLIQHYKGEYATNMFNEPILFVRFMKVEDDGSKLFRTTGRLGYHDDNGAKYSYTLKSTQLQQPNEALTEFGKKLGCRYLEELYKQNKESNTAFYLNGEQETISPDIVKE